MCKAYELGKIPNSFDDVNYFNVKKLKLLSKMKKIYLVTGCAGFIGSHY